MPSLETYFWKNIQIGDAVVRRRQRNFGIITFNYHIYSGLGKVAASCDTCRCGVDVLAGEAARVQCGITAAHIFAELILK